MGLSNSTWAHYLILSPRSLFFRLTSELTWHTSIIMTFTSQRANSSPTWVHLFSITFLENQSRATPTLPCFFYPYFFLCFTFPRINTLNPTRTPVVKYFLYTDQPRLLSFQ